jgi:integrase
VKTRTPGIFKRGNRYVIVWRHRGRQHKESYRTMAEAREAKGRRHAGDKRPASRVGFEDYFSQWIESYAGRTARGFSETTRPEYRRPIEAEALPRWRTWKLADVEPADVRDLFGAMRKAGRSTSAIKKLRAALSALFATALDDGLLRSNPVAGVRIPAARDQEPVEERPKALTRADLAVLLAAVPAEWRLLFEFLAHTGMGISETVGLRWEHLDLGENPKVQVREQFYKGQRKGLKSSNGRRDIPLSPGMAARLLAHRRDNYRGPRTPVFASKAGTEVEPANVYHRVLAPAAKAVGFTSEVEVNGKRPTRSTVSFHTFRHTCASMLFEAGRNVKQVSEWLGHADAAFTLRTYVHLMDAGVGGADFFDEAIQPAIRHRSALSPSSERHGR